jgi:hypothetical protein
MTDFVSEMDATTKKLYRHRPVPSKIYFRRVFSSGYGVQTVNDFFSEKVRETQQYRATFHYHSHPHIHLHPHLQLRLKNVPLLFFSLFPIR